MSAKSRIDALIDDTTKMYAYAFLQRDRGSVYGHMYVEIRLPKSHEYSYKRPDGSIKISCQIGTDGAREAMFMKPYAERYGFDARHGDGTLDELEVAVKVMRKIKKGLDALYNTFGEAKNFADYCQRILTAAGVKNLIVEPDGWANIGNLSEKLLVSVGPSSSYQLGEMENTLIAYFNQRKAA